MYIGPGTRIHDVDFFVSNQTHRDHCRFERWLRLCFEIVGRWLRDSGFRLCLHLRILGQTLWIWSLEICGVGLWCKGSPCWAENLMLLAQEARRESSCRDPLSQTLTVTGAGAVSKIAPIISKPIEVSHSVCLSLCPSLCLCLFLSLSLSLACATFIFVHTFTRRGMHIHVCMRTTRYTEYCPPIKLSNKPCQHFNASLCSVFSPNLYPVRL